MSLEYALPESFIGVIAGFEGISDGFTAIHGPTGCKFYPSSLSEEAYQRRDGRLPRRRNLLALGSAYFFGQPRVPCTYLDFGTFVSGASDRLEDMVRTMEGLEPGAIALVNSPGASLIGEDLSAVDSDIPIIVLDHAEYSGSVADGFQDAVLAVLDRLGGRRGSGGLGVCFTGISAAHLGWEDTIGDLAHLLEMCGVETGPCIGAGWSVEDIGRCADADLVVSICPEYGDRILERMSSMGVPVWSSPSGAPIGFGALEDWIRGVCGMVGADPAPAMAEIRRRRTRAADVLLSLESMHSLPKARTFSVECDGSVAYAVTEFLCSYLGMVPVAVRCTSGPDWGDRLLSFLDSRGIPVSDDPEGTPADIIISSGPVCSSAVERGIACEGHPIQHPAVMTVSVEPSPALGLGGTVRLLDRVLNTVLNHHRFRR